jgi:predicted Zn-dependent peptidase
LIRSIRPFAGILGCIAVTLTAAAAPIGAQGTSARLGPTPGERLPVQERVLDNGLRLVVLPRRGAPTVSFVVDYGIGGVNEHVGTTGTAHLLEHLLFKGTTTVGTRNIAAEKEIYARMDAAADTLNWVRARGDSTAVGRLTGLIGALEDTARVFIVSNEFDRILTRAGAQSLNATTTNESTIYYVELPSNRAQLWFVLEGDRMRNPVFREFYTERSVVMEERRMRVETNPAGLLYEAHLAAAFTEHPYRLPVVGYMADLQSLTRHDVDRYYQRFYGPNNAVVAVVGDVDADQVFRWAKEYLAPVPRGEDPPPVLSREPEQRGERRVVVRWDAKPALRIGWHVPSVYDADAPVLAMLTSVLTGGRTSRLYRRLVERDRLATSVTSSMGPGDRYPRLFQVSAVPRAPHTTEEVEAAIYEELARLATEGPTEAELGRVKNQVEAGDLRRLQSNLGLAFQLAESVSLFGNWRETFRHSARLAAVTTDDVRRAVAQYFTQENRTVAILAPPVDQP